MTNQAESMFLEAAKALDPNAPIVQVAQTVVDPSPANILVDIEMAINLVKQLQAALSGTHPSVMKVVKAVIKEMF